jgi:uncharacterized membrane protein YGL010W
VAGGPDAMLSCLFDGRARLEISLALLVIGWVLAFVTLGALGFEPPVFFAACW